MLALGILFNHESPLGGHHFVTRKITIGLAKIKLGISKMIELGNLNAKRDWGFAADYVEAMHRMLQHKIPSDYVISSGVTHSVKDFINATCDELELKIEWEGEGIKEKAIDTSTGEIIISVNPKYYRPAEVDSLIGDYSKAKEELNWRPKTTFQQLVEMMVKSDLNDLK